MFVRAKTVKGKKYAYLVENAWVKGKVKQKVKKYLGKIVELPDNSKEINQAVDFSLSQKECIKQLIEQEFLSRDFIKKGNKLTKDNITIKIDSAKILEEDNNIVLSINGRYLYGSLLKDLLNFYEPESQEDTKGEKLAKAFSDAGISISPETFIELYKKIYA